MNIRTFAFETGMDYESLMEDFCGDTAAIKERILSFPSDAKFSELKSAVIEKDDMKVKALAHSLRKSAQKLCLGEIESLARKMEESPADKYHSFIEPLEKELGLYSKALEEDS